jgi:hypothetical protein
MTKSQTPMTRKSRITEAGMSQPQMAAAAHPARTFEVRTFGFVGPLVLGDWSFAKLD